MVGARRIVRWESVGMSNETTLVQFRRQPGHRRLARYALAKIEQMQWGRQSGGTKRRSQLHVYGYVWCDQKVDGWLAHSCQHGPPPHRIKVCVTRKYNEKIWDKIAAIAGPKPPTYRQARALRKAKRLLATLSGS